jgi:hypothetical protein
MKEPIDRSKPCNESMPNDRPIIYRLEHETRRVD